LIPGKRMIARIPAFQDERRGPRVRRLVVLLVDVVPVRSMGTPG
jgi:hypothetical protein